MGSSFAVSRYVGFLFSINQFKFIHPFIHQTFISLGPGCSNSKIDKVLFSILRVYFLVCTTVEHSIYMFTFLFRFPHMHTDVTNIRLLSFLFCLMAFFKMQLLCPCCYYVWQYFSVDLCMLIRTGQNILDSGGTLHPDSSFASLTFERGELSKDLQSVYVYKWMVCNGR